MIKGTFILNGYNSWERWRAFIEDKSINTLLEIPPLKPFIENKTRSEAGKRVYINNPQFDEVSHSIIVCFATNKQTGVLPPEQQYDYTFTKRYLDLTSMLIACRTEDGKKVPNELHVPEYGIKLQVLYEASSSLGVDVNNSIGKVVLKLNEPNPSKRLHRVLGQF